MRKTKQTESTVELREVLIVRNGPTASQPCPHCFPAVGALVSPDFAAVMTGTSVRAVFKCLEAGLIHYREVEDGRVLVCLGSLAGCLGSRALPLG